MMKKQPSDDTPENQPEADDESLLPPYLRSFFDSGTPLGTLSYNRRS